MSASFSAVRFQIAGSVEWNFLATNTWQLRFGFTWLGRPHRACSSSN
jgi:hypothetical protein